MLLLAGEGALVTLLGVVLGTLLATALVIGAGPWIQQAVRHRAETFGADRVSMDRARRHRGGRAAGQPGARLARLPPFARRRPLTENLTDEIHPARRLLATAAASLALAQTAPVTPLSNPLPSPSGPKPAAKATAPNPAYKEITWDALVPKDWDPTKAFKDMNLGMLSDSDPRAVEALKRIRETWDNAPTNNAMDDTMVRILATSCRSRTARPA